MTVALCPLLHYLSSTAYSHMYSYVSPIFVHTYTWYMLLNSFRNKLLFSSIRHGSTENKYDILKLVPYGMPYVKKRISKIMGTAVKKIVPGEATHQFPLFLQGCPHFWGKILRNLLLLLNNQIDTKIILLKHYFPIIAYFLNVLSRQRFCFCVWVIFFSF